VLATYRQWRSRSSNSAAQQANPADARLLRGSALKRLVPADCVGRLGGAASRAKLISRSLGGIRECSWRACAPWRLNQSTHTTDSRHSAEVTVLLRRGRIPLLRRRPLKRRPPFVPVVYARIACARRAITISPHASCRLLPGYRPATPRAAGEATVAYRSGLQSREVESNAGGTRRARARTGSRRRSAQLIAGADRRLLSWLGAEAPRASRNLVSAVPRRTSCRLLLSVRSLGALSPRPKMT